MGIQEVDELLIALEIKIDKQGRLRDLQGRLTTIDKQVGKLEEKIKKTNKTTTQTSNSLVGVGMSFMFMGMMIERFFQTALTSLLQSYMAIEGETGAVNNMIGNLLASLMYLGYLFVDAFKESGALKWWVDNIQKLINFFIDLPEGVKSTLMNFAIWGLILGILIGVLGTLIIWINAVITALDMLIAKQLLSGAWKFFGNMLMWIGKVAIGAGIIVAIIYMIIVLWKFAEAAGGVWNFFKMFIAGMLKGILQFFDFSIEYFLTPMLMMLKAAEKLASFLNLPFAKSLADAVAGLKQVQITKDSLMESGRIGIDKFMGMDQIRAQNPNITDLQKILTLSAGKGSAGEAPTAPIYNNITINNPQIDKDYSKNLKADLEENLKFGQGAPQA